MFYQFMFSGSNFFHGSTFFIFNKCRLCLSGLRSSTIHDVCFTCKWPSFFYNSWLVLLYVLPASGPRSSTIHGVYVLPASGLRSSTIHDVCFTCKWPSFFYNS